MTIDDFKREARHTTDEDKITELCHKWLLPQISQDESCCRNASHSNGWLHNDDCINWVMVY